ncbi:hypothetical protein P7C70_g853, partial [Phenoliferia sp. Uapishka_3]
MSYSHDQYASSRPNFAPDDLHTPPGYPPTDQFSRDDFVGQDQSGRRDQYPPVRDSVSGDYGGYEKSTNPMTRGSIAAQMAAEGQIPKKEGLRMWRADEHAGALTRGGKGRACGRICCCSIILVIIILVSIVASFLLWTRPPDVTFNGVEAPANGSEVAVQSNGFLLNFQLNIGVINPNFFGVNFKEIEATGAYSTAPTQNLGGGSLKNVDIKKNSNTTIHFPFTINYTLSDDPTLAIAKDIVSKCGLLGGTKEDLTIDYTVTLHLKLLSTTISPSFVLLFSSASGTRSAILTRDLRPQVLILNFSRMPTLCLRPLRTSEQSRWIIRQYIRYSVVVRKRR